MLNLLTHLDKEQSYVSKKGITKEENWEDVTVPGGLFRRDSTIKAAVSTLPSTRAGGEAWSTDAHAMSFGSVRENGTLRVHN